MILPTYKNIVTLFAAFIFSMSASAQLLSDSVVFSDSEIEKWLEFYATPKSNEAEGGGKAVIDTVIVANTLKPDTVAVTIVGKTEPGTQYDNSSLQEAGTPNDNKKQNINQSSDRPNRRKNRKPKANVLDNIAVKELVYAEDSLMIRKNALSKSLYNPLFLDWVIGTTEAVSMSLTSEDSVTVSLRSGAKEYIRNTAPELYSYHAEHLPKPADIKNRQLNNISPNNLLLRYDELNNVKSDKIDIDFPDIPKWSRGARFQLHVSQSYISPNWYKGGESNLAGNLYVLGYYNYNNHKNLQWDNKIEWKLGVNSAGSDTLRMFRVNEDLFRINSKLGLKAVNNFYYTAEADLQTSFFNTFKPNSYVRTSGFLSPIRMNISAGIDYKYKSELSVFLSPISYKLIYVVDTDYHSSVSPSENIPNQVGITDGGRMLNQLGALLRLGWKHDFNESIGMEVNFSIFGNYVGDKKGVETDCEIIGNFIINRYLSAKISLNPRYDSTVVTSDGEKAKMQFKELVSLGFNYKI